MKVESECIASQNSSSTAGSSPSNSDRCRSGSQVVGRLVRMASVSLPQPGYRRLSAILTQPPK